jgi:hypothetical protein
VDHAHDVVERVLEDGQSGMRLLSEARDELVERAIDVDGDDVGPRHHHVLDRPVAQLQDVGEEDALVGGY